MELFIPLCASINARDQCGVTGKSGGMKLTGIKKEML